MNFSLTYLAFRGGSYTSTELTFTMYRVAWYYYETSIVTDTRLAEDNAELRE